MRGGMSGPFRCFEEDFFSMSVCFRKKEMEWEEAGRVPLV